jgi:hypothetical protein
MGTYNHTHSEKMTKKLCTELFGSVLQLYNPRPNQSLGNRLAHGALGGGWRGALGGVGALTAVPD